MATKKSSRNRVRAAKPPVQTRDALIDICRHLRLATATVVVSVEALRGRNADMDEEIAIVLQRGASDRMDAQVERLEALIADRRW